MLSVLNDFKISNELKTCSLKQKFIQISKLDFLRKFFLKVLLCLSLSFFLACAPTYQSIDLAPFELKVFEIKKEQKSEILYLRHKNNIYQFALFDAFGAPLASKIFENNVFKNDKFLPSKKDYEPLFYEILKMIEKNKMSMDYKEFKVKEL